MSMEIDEIAALKMRVKAAEADTETALKRTLELSRLVAELSATVRRLAELGSATQKALNDHARRHG